MNFKKIINLTLLAVLTVTQSCVITKKEGQTTEFSLSGCRDSAVEVSLVVDCDQLDDKSDFLIIMEDESGRYLGRFWNVCPKPEKRSRKRNGHLGPKLSAAADDVRGVGRERMVLCVGDSKKIVFTASPKILNLSQITFANVPPLRPTRNGGIESALEFELEPNYTTLHGDWAMAKFLTFRVGKDGKEETNETFLYADDEFFSVSVATSGAEDSTLPKGIFAVSGFCDNLKQFKMFGGVALKGENGKITPHLSFQNSGAHFLSRVSQARLRPGQYFASIYVNKTESPLYHNETVMSNLSSIVITVSVAKKKYDASKSWFVVGVSFVVGVILSLLYRVFFVKTREFASPDGIPTRAPSTNSFKALWLWMGLGGKSFSTMTVILCSAFFVPGSQFVLWNVRSQYREGTNDLCYYNEKCFSPAPQVIPINIPFNNIVSNVPYVVLGFVFLVYVFSLQHRCSMAGHLRYFDYSLGYALGLAMFMEGLFSASYHVCPTRLVFQFDSLCMFLIAALVVVAVFNGWCLTDADLAIDELIRDRKKFFDVTAEDDVFRALKRYECGRHNPSIRRSIRAGKLFLVFIVPIVVFNFLGSLIDVFLSEKQEADWLRIDYTEERPRDELIFGVLVIIWYFLLCFWGFWKGGFRNACAKECWSKKPTESARGSDSYRQSELSDPESTTIGQPSEHERYLPKISVVLVFGVFAILILVFIVFTITNNRDFSQTLLVGSIGLCMTALVVGEMKLYKFLMNKKIKSSNIDSFPSAVGRARTVLLETRPWFIFLLLCYYVICFIVWSAAMYYFAGIGTSNKSIQPQKSRNRNKDCIVLDYYDPHDFWHFLSAIGLMFVLHRALTISFPCRLCRLLYFHPNVQDIFIENEPMKKIIQRNYKIVESI